MARPLRPLVAGGVYHVMSRGDGKAQIFLDARDHLAFLERLGLTVSRFDWRCLSYCLMDNHFHLLVQTPQPNLSRGVQHLKTAYAQFFNRRHNRWGHVFGGRFKSPLIQQDAHLLEVFRYIALNPVRAGRCLDPRAWRWSAHAALMGDVPAPDFLDEHGAHAWFGTPPDRRNYESFLGAPSSLKYEPRGAVFGDEEFKRSVLPPTRPDRDVPVREWGEGRPPLAEIFLGSSRIEAVSIAYRLHGYPLSSIARHVGCDVSTAGRWLRQYEARMSEC
jgi:REP element-mobilizing transposase RayT